MSDAPRQPHWSTSSSQQTSTATSSPRMSPEMDLGGDNLVRHLDRGDQEDLVDEPSPVGRSPQHQGQGDEPEVLQPEHPLMKRFQAALKAHLLRQISRLTVEVLEMEANIRQNQSEREDTGVYLYNLQQDVLKQQQQLDSYHETLSSYLKMREEMEDKLNLTKEKHNNESSILKEAEVQEINLRSELEQLVSMEQQFIEWENEMDSDLAVSQRITEKTKIEKKQLAEEKRKQDIFIFKLTNELANLEAQMVTLTGQFKMKESERDCLRQTTAEANADLQALQSEQQRLIQAWNGVIVSMNQRDKVYDRVMTDLRKVQEQFVSLTKEIEGTKKAANKEMDQNQKLTLVLNKLKVEIANLERLINIEQEKKNVLEGQLSAMSGMLEHTDKDLQQALGEYNRCQQIDKVLQKDIEKLCFEKVELEDAVLQKLEVQITHDKAAKYMNKMVQQLRDKTREQELLMVNTENFLSQASLEAEQQKGLNTRNSFLLEEMKKELALQEKEADKVANDLHKSKFTVCKKQGLVDMLNKRLEIVVSKSGSEDMSPEELKIVSLTKSIDEMTEKSEQLQQFWLRQQGHIVQLSQQRNDQLREINLMRKQVIILDQKNLKMEYEITKQNKEEQAVSRSINALLHKLTSLNLQLCERKDYKDTLDKENLITQNHYLSTLKDSECASIKLEHDVKCLEEEKVQLAEKLLEVQRESLVWEKKVQMAIETKQNMHKELSSEGELGAMKSEIHRMEVRYSQLKRAQEKLVNDLEHCVSRREAIVDLAEAREKRSVRGAHNTRCNFQKKLEDLRTKVKQTNMEAKATEHQMTKMEDQRNEMLQQLNEKQHQLNKLQETATEVDKQLEEGLLIKQKNLELLIHRQHRVRMYEEAKAGRHRLLFRTESGILNEIQRQKTLNADLISILESLLTDFPSQKFKLTKILNTLRLYA